MPCVCAARFFNSRHDSLGETESSSFCAMPDSAAEKLPDLAGSEIPFRKAQSFSALLTRSPTAAFKPGCRACFLRRDIALHPGNHTSGVVVETVPVQRPFDAPGL